MECIERNGENKKSKASIKKPGLLGLRFNWGINSSESSMCFSIHFTILFSLYVVEFKFYVPNALQAKYSVVTLQEGSIYLTVVFCVFFITMFMMFISRYLPEF